MMSDIIIIIGLILLNGLFAMSEIAIISARKHQLEKRSREGSRGASIALRLASDPDIFLSTIQIGITLIGILTGIYSGDALGEQLGAILSTCGMSEALSVPVAKIFVVAVVTYLTLVLGELVPKRIGMAAAERVARAMSLPVYWLSVVAKPFVWLLAKSSSGLVLLFGLKSDSNKVTEEEIKSIIQEGTEDGEVKKVEQDIVERVFLMGDLKVSAIMTHRSDVVCVDMADSAEQIRQILSENLHDNYPVVDRNIDNVVGVITLKDLILHINDNDFTVSTILQKPFAVHENMSIYDCLERLKSDHKAGFALVYDEFGSCQGVITLRDILEGLVGVVNPDRENPQIVPRMGEQGWLVDGQCPFYDFLVYFELEDETNDTDYNTVSGLILSRLGHIPAVGEKVQWRKFVFEVVDMDGARIDKVLVARPM